jgi:formylglycine-generating enzyme required for sulfatase activity
VLPAGTFTMGSPPDEQQLAALRADNVDALKGELPQRGVNVASFAIGVQAVSRAQFAAFVRAAKYQTDAEKSGGCGIWQDNRYQRQHDKNWLNPGIAQTDDHPVVCVSWNDAQAYVQWLSQTTGRAYRLPSEAEREYATRAGQTTHFWWGDRIGTDQANYNGNFVYHRSARGEFRQKTMPGNSFKANPFGLFGLHGNVYEWVEDCWHNDYNGAPVTATAWRLNCARAEYVRRGGSWVSNPVYLRSAYRARGAADMRESGTGFRVALGG